MLNTRPLGCSELYLTRVGLGTWAMGGGDWKFGWGPQDDRQSIETIHRALDLGVNWIDTAPAYGLGHCEEVVGRALEGIRERPIVATKCGRVWSDDRQLFPRLDRASVFAEAEASLRRLRVDVIDLYQMHWPQPAEDIEEGWSAMLDLVDAGKVRYAGVCNFNVDQLARVQALGPVTSLQPPYSLLNRQVEEELLPYCAVHQVGVVAYSPMQKGLLTGKVTAEWVARLPANDHRRNDAQFQSPRLDATLRLVDVLREVGQRNGKTVGEVAIAWVLRRPEVTAAIVGARRPDQIEQTAAAANWEIPPEDLAQIAAALHAQQPSAV